jgi:hypothetical protein
VRACLCVSGERAGEKAIPRSLNHNPAAGKLQIYKPGQRSTGVASSYSFSARDQLILLIVQL